MFIWNKHLDRRTFLRGTGAMVALPLLDAMIPARRLLASTAGRAVPRLAFVYFPHGAIMDEWVRATVTAPPEAGQRVLATAPLEAGQRVIAGALELGRILEPLAPYRNRLTVVSGLENRHAYGPVHAITPGTWLSGRSPRKGTDVADAVTADQLAAEQMGQDAPVRSLAVAAEEPRTIGAGIWEGEYDESQSTTISFRRGQVPVPMEFRPRAVYDTLFHSTPPRRVRAAGCTACGATGAARVRRVPGPTSTLDRVAGDAAGLRKRLGPADRAVLGAYLDTIRDVERRVDKAEVTVCSSGESQAEIAQGFTERLALMFDLIALAFRADITRVASIMMAAEASVMTYDHLGVADSFHLLSHHQNDPEKIEQLRRIQTFHTRMLATFVRTLAELPDGDGSILERSLILFGSNMSDSHAHDHFPLPLAVIGGGCGTVRGGRHLRYPDHTPMSNLLLTMLHRAGVGVESVGDSTCGCAEL
ncbi:MAG: DUF1552 domain-containing protein [Acidobacteriota bacterium]